MLRCCHGIFYGYPSVVAENWMLNRVNDAGCNLLWDISRYLKNKIKGGPQYVVPAIFLKKINKGEIRTANPTLSAAAKRFDL